MRLRQLFENDYGQLTADAMEEIIRKYAVKHGVDADTAVKVWKSEGGMKFQSQVDRRSTRGTYKGKEDSWGPFQLFLGGGLGNEFIKAYDINPQKLRDYGSNKQWVEKMIDFAMYNASKSGWGAWYGAANVGIGDYDGIPSNPKYDTYEPMPVTSPRPQLRPSDDEIISPTTGTVGVDPETGDLVTYGVDDTETPELTPADSPKGDPYPVDKDSIEKAIDSALDTNNYKVMPNGDVVWPDGSISPSLKSNKKSSGTAYYLDKDGNLVKK